MSTLGKALPTVRHAEPADEEAVLEMAKRLHVENGLFTLNIDKVREQVNRHFNKQGTIVGVIGPVGGELEASTCLALSDFYYTDEWHLAELWNFVDEPYRKGSRNAEALIEFGKFCSEYMKMPFFTGIITNKQMAPKVRLYRRLLGYPTGAFFIHNARWQSEPMADRSALRAKLREFAQVCAGTSSSVPRQRAKEIASVLKEAAQVIEADDNLWGTLPKRVAAQ